LTPKMIKMNLLEGQNLTLNFYVGGHTSAFQAENTSKSWPFMAKNIHNFRTTTKQFLKSPENGFF